MTRTEALKTVLEFVKRYNKQDAEKEVAEAAGVLEAWIEEYDPGSYIPMCKNCGTPVKSGECLCDVFADTIDYNESKESSLDRVYRGIKERAYD